MKQLNSNCMELFLSPNAFRNLLVPKSSYTLGVVVIYAHCYEKGKAKFTSIGPDHAIEQVIKKLKICGGITGITQKPETLDRYFIIAPELFRISNEFKDLYTDKKDKSEKHNELTGSKSKRMAKNLISLIEVIKERDVFGKNQPDSIFNIFSNKKVSDNIAKDIVNKDEIGQKMFVNFVNERLIRGELSIFDPVKRSTVQTFTSTETASSNGKVKLKEQRNLLHRFIRIAKTKNLELKSTLGEYEFQVIPRSLFLSDGSLLLPNDKSKIIHEIECLMSTNTAPLQLWKFLHEDSCRKRIILLDGMAVVNSITKKSGNISTVADFAKLFKEKVLALSSGFDECRVVFDRYIDG